MTGGFCDGNGPLMRIIEGKGVDMMESIGRLLRQRPVLSVVFLASLLAMLVFGGRMGLQAIYFADPTHRDQVIEPWMTPRYVAMSYRVPRKVMVEALDLEPGAGPPRSIAQIARDRDLPVDRLIAEITSAIDAHRTRSHE